MPVENTSVKVGENDFKTNGDGVFDGTIPWGTYAVNVSGKLMYDRLVINEDTDASETQAIRFPPEGTF